MQANKNFYKKVRLTLILVFLVPVFSACGAAAGGQASTTEETVPTFTLSGRIDTSSSSAFVQKSSMASQIKAVSKETVAGDVYTMNGELIGTFETDENGEFQASVAADKIKKNQDQDKMTLVVTTDVGIEKCIFVDAEDLGSDMDLGTADLTTTLATASVTAQISDFEGWGKDYSKNPQSGGELDCLYQISQSLWQEGSSVDHPLLMKALNAYGQSISATPAYAALELQSTGDVQSAVGHFLGEIVAADYSTADASGLCNAIESGDIELETVVAPLLQADTFEEFSMVFGDESAAKVHLGLMQECMKKNNCEEIKDNASVVFETLMEYQGDYSSILSSDGEVDAFALNEIVDLAQACGDDSKGNDCEAKEDNSKNANENDNDNDNANDKDNENENENEKVTICHIPPGNPANAHTIEISENALAAHIDHGDVLGACNDSEMSEQEPEVDEEALEETVEEILDSPVTEEVVEEVTEIVVGLENPETEPLAVGALDEIADEIAADPVAMEDPEYDELVQTGTSDLSSQEITESLEDEICEESEDKGFSTLWQYKFGYICGGFYRMIPGPSAAIGNMRPGTTTLEIATGNEEYYPLGWGGPMGRWFLFDAMGKVLFWKDTENDEAHSSVNLSDLNGDGVLDMVGGTTSGNQVQAFDGQSKWLWRHILLSHSISTPAVAELSGITKVFSGSMDGYVRKIDGKTGALDWSYYIGEWIWGSAAVADLDHDGQAEVVIAGYNGSLYCFNAVTGTLKWKTILGYNTRATAALANVDSDTDLEVLIGDGNGVFSALAGKTGELKWSYATQGSIQSSAAVGDLDGDLTFEIVFGSADGNMYALNGDGTLFWKRQMGGIVYASPALARRVPGTVLHVYAASMAGELAVLDGSDGKILAKMDIGYEIASSPVVGDVDGDGTLEVFFQDRRAEQFGMKGDHFWSVRDEGSLVSPYAREWPVFRGNREHTGVYSEE